MGLPVEGSFAGPALFPVNILMPVWYSIPALVYFSGLFRKNNMPSTEIFANPLKGLIKLVTNCSLLR